MVTASPREYWSTHPRHARLGRPCQQLLVLTSMDLSLDSKTLVAAKSAPILLPGYSSRYEFGDGGRGTGGRGLLPQFDEAECLRRDGCNVDTDGCAKGQRAELESYLAVTAMSVLSRISRRGSWHSPFIAKLE